MNLAPFLNASPVVQIHVVSAITAFFLGSMVLWRRKGTGTHRFYGRIWVGLMMVTALSSFFIHELRTWGLFSPIHLISIGTILSLAWAIYAVRNGNISAHKYSMQGAFVGGLVIAGGFAFLPGRLMNRIVFDSGSFYMFTRMEAILVTFLGVVVSIAFVAWLASRERRQ